MPNKSQPGGGGSVGIVGGGTTAAGGTRGSSRSIKGIGSSGRIKAKRIQISDIKPAKPARRVGVNGKRITRKNKLVSNNGASKAKKKGVTVMFTPTRKVVTDEMGMSNKLNSKQMRKSAGSKWNMSMAKKPTSFKQARKAMEQDRVRYNTAEKKLNKTEKTLGSPVMWNFKPSLYNRKGILTKANTRSFPKKSAPIKPSSLRMNKKGKK